MGLLEDALRDTFTSRVAAPPAAEDRAGAAIRRGGAIRRRRAAMTSVAAVVTVLLVGVGVLAVRAPGSAQFGSGAVDPPSASVVPPAPLVGVRLPIDVLNGDRIQAADGRVISIAGLGTAERALRVSPGWLVQTANNLPSRSAVWLVDESGFASQLASGDATMVSSGTAQRPSPQVAWTNGDRLSVASFVGRTLTGTASTADVDKLDPVRAVDDGVLLGGGDVWDMWYPDKGAYRPTTTKPDGVSAVVGVTADRSQLLGLAGGRAPCFGVLDPPGFTLTRSDCEVGVGRSDKVYESPTGRWWLVVTATGFAVYNTDPTYSPRLVYAGALERDSAATGLWLDGETFAIYAKRTLYHVVLPGSVGATSRFEVPDPRAPGATEIIEDLR